MAAVDTVQANALLDAILLQQATASTTSMSVKLGSNSPSGGTDMTELPNGNGYTTGGLSCSFTAAATVSGVATSYNSTSLTWMNSSGGWTINGIEIWDAASVRWMYGTWVGAPIAVASGNSFTVPPSGIQATLT